MAYNRIMSADHKNHIAQAMKGKRHTDATKEKISKAIKARWAEVPKTTPSTKKNNEY